MALTNKQKLFVEYYLQCWNGAEAARRAGYKGNETTITSTAHENLTKPDIKEYIDKRMDEVSMSANEILARLTEWGRGTVEPFLSSDDFSEALNVNSEESKKAIGLIKKIKQQESVLKGESSKDETVLSRRFELELHDAKDAVIQLAKIRGMYTEKVHHSGGMEFDGFKFIIEKDESE